MNNGTPEPITEIVDGVPVTYLPPVTTDATRLAIWLPPFTKSKESTIPFLQELANMGLFAVSIDPWQHGERGFETPEELVGRVFAPGNFRRYIWPIIGQTTLDAKHVIDWAQGGFGPFRSVVAGGLSMGGDVAVALAGIDERVSRVAAVVATPDWTRPGMRLFDEPYGVVDQGDPDAYANWFYNEIDPITHLQRYERNCAITFECAENDEHVPPDGALRFRDALKDSSAPIRVNLHTGYSHGDGSEAVFVRNCLDWLSA